MKGVPFANRRYKKGVPFLSKMVYKRLRDWTSGHNLSVQNFVEYPPWDPSPSVPYYLKKNKMERKEVSIGFQIKHKFNQTLDCCTLNYFLVRPER